MRRRWLALLLSALALGLVAGCGGDDDEDENGAAATTEEPAETAPAEEAPAEEEPEAPAGGGEVALSSPEGGALEFDTTELSAPAGEVTITYDNPSTIPHNVTIEETGDATETFTEGTETLAVELEPGDYTFFCSVAGHRQAGMEGTLTVE